MRGAPKRIAAPFDVRPTVAAGRTGRSDGS
jgi:hypothetical protein